MRDKNETVEFGEGLGKGVAVKKAFEREHLEVDGNEESNEFFYVDVVLINCEIRC